MLAALALIPLAGYAHDDAHRERMQEMMPGMMHGKSEAGHAENGDHVHGVGNPGDPRKVSRTIRLVMSDDMKFTPAEIEVKRGETIRFVLKNAGQIKHEMVIGSMAELKQHADLMRRMPGMEHADSNQVTLAPGKTGELIWQFTKAGSIDFACLEPGHFDAGMRGAVSVK